MLEINAQCEECEYYGNPVDAPENVKDCLFWAHDGEIYPPCYKWDEEDDEEC